MKSRIRKAQPFILSYNLSDEKQNKLSDFCFNNQIINKAVTKNEAGFQLGYLCEFTGFTNIEKPCDNPPEKECLVFSGIESNNLRPLLSKLRENNVAVDLKAICTSSNQSWALCDLIKELSEEHTKLNGGRK